MLPMMRTRGAKRRPAMKKNSTSPKSPKQAKKESRKACPGPITIGMDLGDKTSRYCMLDNEGAVWQEGSVGSNKTAMKQVFASLVRCRIAIEVGTHSPWLSRLLKSFGHEVIVANARQVKLISQSSRKDDRLDAQTLARLARVDASLLRPIRHRSEKAQGHLMTIRVRASLIDARTSLVNAARGMSKAVGERLPKCDTDQMGVEQLRAVPAELQETLQPLLQQVESLTE